MNWIGGARSRLHQQPGGRGGYSNYNYGGGYGRGNFGRSNQREVTGRDDGPEFGNHIEDKRDSPLLELVKSKVPNGNLLALQLSHQMEIDKKPKIDADMVASQSQVDRRRQTAEDLDNDNEQEQFYEQVQFSDSEYDMDVDNPEGQSQRASISDSSSGCYSPLSSAESTSSGQFGKRPRSQFSDSSEVYGTPTGHQPSNDIRTPDQGQTPMLRQFSTGVVMVTPTPLPQINRANAWTAMSAPGSPFNLEIHSTLSRMPEASYNARLFSPHTNPQAQVVPAITGTLQASIPTTPRSGSSSAHAIPSIHGTPQRRTSPSNPVTPESGTSRAPRVPSIPSMPGTPYGHIRTIPSIVTTPQSRITVFSIPANRAIPSRFSTPTTPLNRVIVPSIHTTTPFPFTRTPATKY